jgi:hypothetical protein
MSNLATDLREPVPGDHPHTAALRNILRGSCIRGRWLIEEGDHSGECPDGYDEHDEETEPPGCYWEPYTAEEQTNWLDSVADMARGALSAPMPYDVAEILRDVVRMGLHPGDERGRCLCSRCNLVGRATKALGL